MFFSSECCVLSGRGLCDELITRPEKSCLLWCVGCVWSRNLVNEGAMAHWGLSRQKQTNKQTDLKWVEKLRQYALVGGCTDRNADPEILEKRKMTCPLRGSNLSSSSP